MGWFKRSDPDRKLWVFDKEAVLASLEILRVVDPILKQGRGSTWKIGGIFGNRACMQAARDVTLKNAKVLAPSIRRLNKIMRRHNNTYYQISVCARGEWPQGSKIHRSLCLAGGPFFSSHSWSSPPPRGIIPICPKARRTEYGRVALISHVKTEAMT